VWVFATQTDKLVLSNLLPLAEYGYFTLAVLTASGIMMIGGPISSAILPRMTNLEAQGNHTEVIRIYRQSTQFVVLFAGSISITLAMFAEEFLIAWTGNSELASEAAPILALYAMGNGILTVAAFPYYLQYAKGNLRLHVVGNIAFVFLLVPAIVLAASYYKGVGAGYAWLAVNLASFLFWVPFVHHRFAPGLNAKWYFADIFPIAFPLIALGLTAAHVLEPIDNRWQQLAVLCMVGVSLFSIGAIASSDMRKQTMNILKLVGRSR